MATNWSAQQLAIFGWFAQPVAPGEMDYNLVVRARAGTGKTTTIIEGINRAPETTILLCAFNKRIAEELSVRITNPNAHAQTLHSLGFQAVKRYWDKVGVAKGSERADGLAETVCGLNVPVEIKRLVSKLHTKAREINPHARNVGDITGLLYAFECEPEESWATAGFDAEFVEKKALAAMELAATVRPVAIDFADMIYLPVRNGWLHGQFDLVVVDEAQDMTIAQLEIAQGLCKGRLAVVGDDRQAIYGFRGADSESLDRLKTELNAVELGLNITYRCGTSIVELAQTLVPDFQAGPSNPTGEVLHIVDTELVAAAKGGDFILSRMNAPLVGVAMALLRNQKRARVAGKDIGAGLKALVRKLARTARTVDQLMERVAAWESAEVARFTAAKRDAQVDAVRDKAETIIAISDGARNVGEIEERIDALFTDDGLGQAGVINCSSVHKSKGLEANRVFVLESTLYPRGVTKEESNIHYVAVTRAKQTLVMVAKAQA